MTGEVYLVDNEIQCTACRENEKAENALTNKPGYHIRNINKGVLGEPSKIFEEVEEFRDAIEQGVDLMALIELSDLMGAISAYLARYHPSIDIEQLRKMNDVTARAFQNGRR